MAIKPSCDLCKNELVELGGLLLSPPTAASMVRKEHLCTGCYNTLQNLLSVIRTICMKT